MQTLDTFIAINRFGLGPKRGEADRVAKNPRKCVRSQIDRDQKTPKSLAAFRSSADIIKELEKTRKMKDTKTDSMRRMTRNDARENYFQELYQRAVHSPWADYSSKTLSRV